MIFQIKIFETDEKLNSILRTIERLFISKCIYELCTTLNLATPSVMMILPVKFEHSPKLEKHESPN